MSGPGKGIQKQLRASLLIGVAVSAQFEEIGAQEIGRLDLQEELRMVSSGNSADLRRNTRLAVGADGRLFAAPIYTPGSLAAYDSAGAFEMLIGREGQGPGELSLVGSFDI